MEEQEVSILHPLATLDWEDCTPLPQRMSHPQCVLLHDVLYVGGKLEDKTKLFMSKTVTKHLVWKVCLTPTYYYSLTTYRSQLVLLGGLNTDTGQASDKLWTLSSNAGMKWSPSIIKDMPTKRWEASAVNTGNPEYIVVAGGLGVGNCILDTVEVFTGKEWCTAAVEPLPNRCSYLKWTLHEGKCYLCGGDYQGSNIYGCDLKLLLKSCEQSGVVNKAPLPLWSKFQVPLSDSNTASFGQHLISIGGKQLDTYSPDIVALSPLSQSWVHVGKLPIALRGAASIVLPTGELVVIGGDTGGRPGTRVFKATLRVPPYDPDSTFSMNSLSRLEEGAGFNIVKSLAEIPAQLASVLGVTTEMDQQVEITIKKWVSGGSQRPLTWRSLLDILWELDLEDLSQEIENYMHGKPKYLNAYHHILATQESIDMWFIKIIFLGAPSLGKTTVRRRLGGEIADISSSGEAVQPSTGTVESSIVIRNLSSNTALVTPSQWSVSKDLTEEVNMILQFFANYTHEGKVFDTASSNDDRADSHADKAAVSSNKGLSIVSSSPKEIHNHPKDAIVSEVSSSGRKLLLEVTEMFHDAASSNDFKHLFKDTAFLKMEDTGGQPEFMDMLAALTIGPALYLLFCNLNSGLQSHYTMSYHSPSGESTTPVQSTYTVEEFLLTALASASCFSSYSTTSHIGSEESTSAREDELLTCSKKSVAYILGTHKDLVSKQQIAEFDKKLQNTIRSTAFFQENLVQFSSKDQMILPIDNMYGGEDEIKKVRRFLEQGMKKHFKKLSIPASWLVLNLCLRKRGKRTATLETVLLLARELGMPEREAMLSLWFLHHHAGVLMYFPKLEELKDTVICDTQIVYDSATNLIVNTFKFGSVGMAASERFRETGQFTLEDIGEATSRVSGDYIPLLKLVKLLEHLNIIALITPSQSSEVSYFMPCVLQNATHEELDKWWESNSSPHSPAPLFIRYDCGFSLIGIFPAMIANLAGNESLQLVVDGIKKNRVQFRMMGGDYDTFTLISHPKYYAVHITREPGVETPTHEVCSTVRGIVESTLKVVTSKMNYSFCAEYHLSFECPSHPGRDHLCTVEKSAVSSPRRSSFVLFLDHPCMEMQLEWKDLCEISHRMVDWEEKLYSHFGLSEVDIQGISKDISDIEMQRREVLRRWQKKLGSGATYGKLLEVFVQAGHTGCVDTLCEVLKGRCDEKDTLPHPAPEEMLCLKENTLLEMQGQHLVWYGKPFKYDSELEYESSKNDNELGENDSELSWGTSVGEPSTRAHTLRCGRGWIVAVLVILVAILVGSVLTFSPSYNVTSKPAYTFE